MEMILLQLTGWVGAILYITGYGLLSLNRLDGNSVAYHILNATGGVCLVIFSASLADVPNTIVNIVWILIAAFSLMRILRLKRGRSQRVSQFPTADTPVS